MYVSYVRSMRYLRYLRCMHFLHGERKERRVDALANGDQRWTSASEGAPMNESSGSRCGMAWEVRCGAVRWGEGRSEGDANESGANGKGKWKNGKQITDATRRDGELVVAA